MSKIHKEDIRFNRKEQKNPIKKWAEDLNRFFFQRRYTNGQQVHEKVLNITKHQGNANQDHNEIPVRMATIKKKKKNTKR